MEVLGDNNNAGHKGLIEGGDNDMWYRCYINHRMYCCTVVVSCRNKSLACKNYTRIAWYYTCTYSRNIPTLFVLKTQLRSNFSVIVTLFIVAAFHTSKVPVICVADLEIVAIICKLRIHLRRENKFLECLLYQELHHLNNPCNTGNQGKKIAKRWIKGVRREVESIIFQLISLCGNNSLPLSSLLAAFLIDIQNKYHAFDKGARAGHHC